MNEVYCYDHHLRSYYDDTRDSSNDQDDAILQHSTMREEDEEDIQTIQSDAMMTSSTVPPSLLLTSPPLEITESPISNRRRHTDTNHPKDDDSIKGRPRVETASEPPSPTTTTTSTNAISSTSSPIPSPSIRPPRTLVDTDQDDTTSPPPPLSSSQSLLYHTLASTTATNCNNPTTPSPIMTVIVAPDKHPKNHHYQNRNDPYGPNEPQRTLCDVDDDTNRSGHANRMMLPVHHEEENTDQNTSMIGHRNDGYHHNTEHDDPVEIASTMSYSTILSSLSGHEYFDTNMTTIDDDKEESVYAPNHHHYDDDDDQSNNKNNVFVVPGTLQTKPVYDLTTPMNNLTNGTALTTAGLLVATTWSTSYDDDDDDDDIVDIVDRSQMSPPQPTTNAGNVHESNNDDRHHNNRSKKDLTHRSTTIHRLKQRYVTVSILFILFVIMMVGLTYGITNARSSGTNSSGGTDSVQTNSLDETNNNESTTHQNNRTNNIFGNVQNEPGPAPTVNDTTTGSTATFSPTTTNLPSPANTFVPTMSPTPPFFSKIDTIPPVTSAPSFNEQNVDPRPTINPPAPSLQLRFSSPPTNAPMIVFVPIPTPSSFARPPSTMAPVRRTMTPVRAPTPVRTPTSPTNPAPTTVRAPVRVPMAVPVRIVVPTNDNNNIPSRKPVIVEKPTATITLTPIQIVVPTLPPIRATTPSPTIPPFVTITTDTPSSGSTTGVVTTNTQSPTEG